MARGALCLNIKQSRRLCRRRGSEWKSGVLAHSDCGEQLSRRLIRSQLLYLCIYICTFTASVRNITSRHSVSLVNSKKEIEKWLSRNLWRPGSPLILIART